MQVVQLFWSTNIALAQTPAVLSTQFSKCLDDMVLFNQAVIIVNKLLFLPPPDYKPPSPCIPCLVAKKIRHHQRHKGCLGDLTRERVNWALHKKPPNYVQTVHLSFRYEHVKHLSLRIPMAKNTRHSFT